MKDNRYVKSILLLIALIPFLNQFNNTYGGLGYLIYVPYIMIIVVANLYRKKEDSTISNNSLIQIVVVLLLFSYTISPVLGLTIFKYTPLENIIYIALFYIFIIFLFNIYKIIDSKEKYNELLKYITIGNSLILIINLTLNINEIQYIDFNTILTNERAIRASFGINHPNTTAMYILIEMLLIYLFIIKEKKKKKIGFIIILILSVFLIATGSRTANICLIIFILLEVYSNITKRLNKYIRVNIFLVMLSIGILFLVYKSDFSSLLNSMSGRDRAFINNLYAIKEYGNILVGIAPTSIMVLNNQCMLDFADNWYIVQMIQFGILGIIPIFVTIIILLTRFMKYRNTMMVNLILVMLVYSTAERVLFVPGVNLSVILWILIVINIQRISNLIE